MDESNKDFWYENKHLLNEGMVFVEHTGDVVKLDRRVPGDGTKWYVANATGPDSWGYYDGTVEPGDLMCRLVQLEAH